MYCSLPAKARAWTVVMAPQDAGMTICGGIHTLHGWAPPPPDLVHMHTQTGDRCEQHHEQVMHRGGRVSQFLFQIEFKKKFELLSKVHTIGNQLSVKISIH